MTLWIPQKGDLRDHDHNYGTVGAATLGTQVTTGAGSSTKGTAVELITSTAYESYLIEVHATLLGLSATASEGCLDILIGAATEEVLIPNLLCGYTADPAAGRLGRSWLFPLYIAKGTRIAAQAASLRTATAFRVGVRLYGGNGIPPFRYGTKVTTYGIGTVPNATAVTAGASGAEGSFTQITASTTENHFAIVPSMQCTGVTNMKSRAMFLDVGFGAATEEEIMQSVVYTTGSDEMISGPIRALPHIQDIPSGTRLTARLSGSGTLDTYEVALHCVS